MKRIGMWAAILSGLLVILSGFRAGAQTVGASAVLDNRVAVLCDGWLERKRPTGFLYLEDRDFNFCGAWTDLQFQKDSTGNVISATGSAVGWLWTNDGIPLGIVAASVGLSSSQAIVTWPGVSGQWNVDSPWLVDLTR